MQGGVGQEQLSDADQQSLIMVAKDSDLSELTPEERHAINTLIQQEEKKNTAHDVVDILLILLSLENNELEFAHLLEFLEFEFFDAMAEEDYFLAHKICKNVDNISRVIQGKRPWAVSLVNMFFAALARADRFEELPCINRYHEHLADPEKYSYLWSLLTLLPPESMFTLGALASLTPMDNLDLRNRIVQLITAKARKNPHLFARLLEQSGEETNLLLFPIINDMEQKEAQNMYLAMSRHPSPQVRKIGIDGFFQTAPVLQPEKLLHLPADEDRELRKRVITYLQQMDPAPVGEIMLHYLKAEGRKVEDEEHIMQCYRLLSRSPSPEVTSFLKEILLESKLTSMVRSLEKVHKTGAACSLRSMDTGECREILRAGAASLRPDVRNICQKVLDL